MIPGRPEVLLVSLPWAALQEPSLGLAILKAKLAASEIPCTVRHLNIFLLKYLKPSSYDATGGLFAFNDLLFTRALQGPDIAEDQRRALTAFVHDTYQRVDLRARTVLDPMRYVEYAIRMRNEIIPRYLDDCLAAVAESPAPLVGFSCMYDQTFPSLALAKLVKERYPERLIVFGGYAIERPTGPRIMRSFPFVDVIAFGEGEDKIVALAEAAVDRDRLARIPGILYRDASGSVHGTPPGPGPVNLDDSPVPDYDDWFSDVARLDAEHQVQIEIAVLPVESSRGCWWGQASHCVFCGIDDETMRYRSKSPDRVTHMLATLRERYGRTNFRFADYILPRQYYKTVLPDLAGQPDKYQLHWEMKANVDHEDVQLMARAGIDRLQPGIESFSSAVLRRMNKGVTGIQNVLTIKLLMEHDISVYYNLLYAFPTDTLADYLELCGTIPLLYHLTPPVTYVPVLTTRYAPLQADPGRFGIAGPIVAHPRYEMILSRRYREEIDFDLDDYCYVFETPNRPGQELQRLYDILVYQLHHWLTLAASRDVRLSFERGVEGIEFFDSRYDPEGRVVGFGPDHALVYEALCHRILSRRRLAGALEGVLPAGRIDGVLEALIGERLVYQEGERFLALGFPATRYERWAQRRAARDELAPA